MPRSRPRPIPGATTYGGSTISALAIQADGKVVAGGAFDSAVGTAQPGLLRFNTDGSVDPGFSAGVFATTVANTYPSVSTLAVQSDGKIIVGGLFETIGGVAASSVARLNTDGSVDTSFNAGGVGPDTYVTSVVVQPDGDIVVAGAFATFNGVPSAQVARLRGDGSVDPLFFPGAGTGNTGFINSLALAPDGSILLAGSFTTFDGQPRDGVARLVGGEVIAPRDHLRRDGQCAGGSGVHVRHHGGRSADELRGQRSAGRPVIVGGGCHRRGRRPARGPSPWRSAPPTRRALARPR